MDGAIRYSCLEYVEGFLTIEKILTKEECRVLAYHIKGYTYREISMFVKLSIGTISNRMANIRKKIEQTRQKKEGMYREAYDTGNGSLPANK
jgi:DNA-directed RNA polymerase specialized sigma24 family protein